MQQKELYKTPEIKSRELVTDVSFLASNKMNPEYYPFNDETPWEF